MLNLQSRCVRCCIFFVIIFHLIIGVGIFIYLKFFQEVNDPISLPEKETKLNYIRKLSLESRLPQNDSIPIENLCLTTECLDVSIELLSTIDGSVDPCENFYKFACGGKAEKRSLAFPVPLKANDKHQIISNVLNQPKMESDTRPLIQAREFYKQCLNLEKEETDAQPLTQLISKFGGWPILQPEKWNASNFNFWTTSAKIQSSGLTTAIISTGSRANPRNSAQQMIYIAPGTLGLPAKALRNPLKYSNLISAYKKLIMDVIKELPRSQEESFILSEVEKMINLEKQLANIISIENEMGLNHIQELNEFAKDVGLHELESFISAVFNASDVTVKEREVVLINDISYFKKLKALLDKTEQTTIANYVVWIVIFPMIQFGNQELREAYFRFEKSVKGKDKSLQEICLDQVEENFGMAIRAKYIQGIDKEINSEVKRFLSDIRRALMKAVMQIKAISKNKKGTLAKVSEMIGFISYSDWLEDSKLVEKYYEGIELKNSYFESQVSLLEYKMGKQVKGLRSPTGAKYIHLNAFALPFMYSLPLNFHKTRPSHQNYGREGWQMARDFFHALINDGILYGSTRTNCLKEQYSTWEYPEIGDDEHSLVENNIQYIISDIDGLTTSYRAYQKYLKRNGEELKLPGLEAFTSEQLFFLGNANSNCDAFESKEELIYFLLTSNKVPNQVRVQMSFQNFPEFSSVFKCEVDPDGMNIPEDERC